MTADDHPTAVPFTTSDYAARMERVVAEAQVRRARRRPGHARARTWSG